MKLKRSNKNQPIEQMDCGEQSVNAKSNSGLSSFPSTSSTSSSLVLTKSKRYCANLSHPLQTKLDKLVTKFDQIIFSKEIDFTVIESNFGNQLWSDKVDNADIFWQCFNGALIRKIGFTEDEAYKDFDETNPIATDDISYTEVEASWIWWEIKDKIKRSGLELPSVGNFVGYMAKYLDDPKVESTQLENTILVIAIFIHLYPLSQILEMAQLNNGYILTYLMDQIVDKVLSIQAAIYALFALQRILQASVFLSEVPNYENFQKNLKELASFIPDVVCDMELVPKDDAFQAYQASMLAKVTMQKLIELDKFDCLPEIEKEHELISLHFKNWFCGTSSGYCNYQMDLPVHDISKQCHLYFEMMYLTTGSIKVGICGDLHECFKKYGVDSSLDMTTCEYTFSFDGYMKECSRDNKDNIKMAVGEIKAGSVVGIRLDSMDRTVTYYIDGEEVKEKKKTNRSKGNSRSWESYPYYVTISLAAMQQATILLTKEEWLMQPNFAHELHELFYDNWQFRMIR